MQDADCVGAAGRLTRYRPMAELVDALLSPAERRQLRRDQMLQLTGGWPPGVACMRSNAPWFRAAAAVRWLEAREREDQEG